MKEKEGGRGGLGWGMHVKSERPNGGKVGVILFVDINLSISSLQILCKTRNPASLCHAYL